MATLPLAFSSSALAITGGTVSFALVLLAWLLRRETREESAERAEEQASRENSRARRPGE